MSQPATNTVRVLNGVPDTTVGSNRGEYHRTELAEVWLRDAKETDNVQDGSEGGRLAESKNQGKRMAKGECANQLKQLIATFKDQ